MSRGLIQVDEPLYAYLLKVGLRESDALRALREETDALEERECQISADQGQFMGFLAELIGARQCLEIGTFTGYSALALAQVLPEGGRLIACDVSEEWTAIARRHWDAAGVADKIELRLAPAIDTLNALLAEGLQGTFDLAFIDADKRHYDAYYERAYALLRPGGLIMIDNMLWAGKVIDPEVDDADTKAIRVLNKKVGSDPRVSMSLVPIGDGLLLARKR